MTSSEIRRAFLQFFEERGHRIVRSSSLIPDDPSVLLTTAGMQQFKKYYTGDADPIRDFGTKNTASVQKSFRTSDIDEVGDESHLTFFEMLGNFSFGGYGKEKTIQYAYEFLTRVMGLEISFVTVFKGKESIGVPKDKESIAIWKRVYPDVRIVEQGMEDVFWGPTGSSGPCGPTTEIYVKNAAGDDIEVWNCVFNQYFYAGSRDELDAGAPGKTLRPLETFGVDTGMGLERLAMVAQKTKTIFDTDLFQSLFELLPTSLPEREKRIIADHFRGATFLIADGVRPSNKDRGYILRRLIRRIIVYQYLYKIPTDTTSEYISRLVRDYGDFYPELLLEEKAIRDEFSREGEKFFRTLARGIHALERVRTEGVIDQKKAFMLYETFGIPYEIVKELGGTEARDLTRDAFEKEFRRHQEVSRAGSEAKFGGHGLYLKTGEVTVRDKSELEKVTRLHTATHLLHAGLRAILGPDVRQDGSDITVERTRFDFRFPRKVTSEELKKVEDWVNDAIRRNLVVEWKETDYESAVKEGALGFFREKYPARVKVYTMRDEKVGETFSQELCGGPHVPHTSLIGRFKILKEESSSAGVRRIRAVVEDA